MYTDVRLIYMYMHAVDNLSTAALHTHHAHLSIQPRAGSTRHGPPSLCFGDTDAADVERMNVEVLVNTPALSRKSSISWWAASALSAGPSGIILHPSQHVYCLRRFEHGQPALIVQEGARERLIRAGWQWQQQLLLVR